MIKSKKCIGTCGKTKKLTKDNFEWRSDIKNFRGLCRKCVYLQSKNRQPKPIKIFIENNITYQICSGECQLKLELNETNFKYRKRSNNTFFNQCKVCEKVNRENNKIKINEGKAIYRKNNKEKIKIGKAKHYQENKEEILLKAKEYISRPEIKIKRRQTQRNKRKKLKERIRHNISGSVRNSLKSKNINKNSSTAKCLGYSIDKLKEHLELHFEDWMNWGNYGKYIKKNWKDDDSNTWTWQIDHIKPVTDFEYDSTDHPEFKLCWSLDNLRPYNSKLNQHDGATRIRHKNN